ncbi:FAD-binding protein [Phytohabitans sp. ZYX-F-186]|uniref:FAD-binding protein n=1 Tax=Phytohabitans maris TaxID=3071409 RepID=A0ABU0ZPQ1_9ACTN|nr:FAD-binding protein [Phytohabitans sp. ZYX-F-186]MDQ7908334.1 FAD-binding protein [Phytohabitans sp. ZYX-F-186]
MGASTQLNAPALDGELVTDEGARERAADDFGHLVHRVPRAVVRAGSVRDVAAAVRWAAGKGWPVAARGQGHSVYGRSQAEDGVVIDMAGLAGVERPGADRVRAGAGATWREVLAATLPAGRTPPVLTNYLDLSVGGTLSVGGIGGTSHRYGLQSDSVLELEVVTGDGSVVTCSPAEHPDLFDAVRAGLGQCGVITRATLALVPAPERVRRYTLTYPDLETYAADQELVLREGRADHLQGTVRPEGGGWRYQVEIVVFGDRDPRPGLADRRAEAVVEELSYREHAEAFDRFTALLRSTGAWSAAHPWWLTFLPASTAVATARGVLAGLTPDDLGELGLVTFYPVATAAMATPLVRLPAGPVVYPFNLIRFAPPGAGAAMLARNQALHPRVRAAGGVLYPVSALPFGPADWAEHFGPAWAALRRARERFDPAGVLTPGYELG